MPICLVFGNIILKWCGDSLVILFYLTVSAMKDSMGHWDFLVQRIRWLIGKTCWKYAVQFSLASIMVQWREQSSGPKKVSMCINAVFDVRTKFVLFWNTYQGVLIQIDLSRYLFVRVLVQPLRQVLVEQFFKTVSSCAFGEVHLCFINIFAVAGHHAYLNCHVEAILRAL